MLDTSKHKMVKTIAPGLDQGKQAKKMRMDESRLSLANFDTTKAQEAEPIELGHKPMDRKSMKKTKDNRKSEIKQQQESEYDDLVSSD